jgi:hypothetical protein
MKREGKGDRYVADFWGISTSTLHLWKEEHANFSSQYKKGLEDFTVDMVDNCRNALYKKALGMKVVEVTVEEFDGGTKTRTTTKELPPSELAALAILHNKSGGEFTPLKASDRQDGEIDAPPVEIHFHVNDAVGDVKVTNAKSE